MVQNHEESTSLIGLAQIEIGRKAHSDMIESLMSQPAEAGGALIGPEGEALITQFHPDLTGSCSAVTYTPDHRSLNRRLSEEWNPAGLELKGFAHSHPRGVGRLSPGDIEYISRLLAGNPHWKMFVAPIVLPLAFRLIPYVVFPDQPRTPQRAELVIV